MESASKTQKIENLQELKEQAILRSKQAERPEVVQFHLFTADLYNLAIAKGNATMYGSSITVDVGTSDDAVAKVNIDVRPDFKAGVNYFEVSFGQYQAVPIRIVRDVQSKHFTSAEEAFNFINGLAEKINMFFNGINL